MYCRYLRGEKKIETRDRQIGIVYRGYIIISISITRYSKRNIIFLTFARSGGIKSCVNAKIHQLCLIEFLKTNRALLTDDYECHAVEPWSKVGERPQEDAELQGVDDVLDQEEPAELAEGRVNVGNGDVGDLVHLLRG